MKTLAQAVFLLADGAVHPKTEKRRAGGRTRNVVKIEKKGQQGEKESK